MSAFDVQASNPLPLTKATSLSVEGDYAALAGLDGEAAIYSVHADTLERPVAVKEPVTDTLWVGSKLLFATSRGSVKVYEAGSEVASLSEHAGAVTGLSSHPGGQLLGSVGADKSVVLYDMETMKRVSRAYTDAGES